MSKRVLCSRPSSGFVFLAILTLLSFTTVTATASAQTYTTTVLSTSPHVNSSVFGQQVNFVAYVSNGNGPLGVAPSGEVLIYSYDGGLIGTVMLVDSGPGFATASFKYALLKPGRRDLYAVYVGDSNYYTSSSASTNIDVAPRPVNVTVVPSPGSVGVGAWSTISTTVTDAATTGPSGAPGFSSAPAGTHLQTARTGAAAVLLLNGAIFITGGTDSGGNVLNSAEIYDPVAMTFTTIAATMTSARVYHSATTLQDGTVLIAGGSDGVNGLSSAEIYDPVEGTFTAISGAMTVQRTRHTATLLSSGKVLLIGGDSQGSELRSAEIYDSSSATFSTVQGFLAAPRSGHTATLLADRTHILVTGGDLNGTAEAITYDSGSNAITSLGTATWDWRWGHSATLLPDGNVLIAGGFSQFQGQVAITAEIYQVPASFSSFATTLATVRIPRMTVARQYHIAVLMNNGKIGIAGGATGTVPPWTILDSAESYTPAYDPLGTLGVVSDNASDTWSPNNCSLGMTGSGSSTCTTAILPNHLGSLRTVTATYSSDGNHNSGAVGTATLIVVKGTQPTVTVSAPASATYAETGLVAVASGGAGTGAYVYDAGTSTACTVDANSGALTITHGTGTCAITAYRAADGDYNASAVSATASVTVSPAPLSVTPDGSKVKVYGNSFISFTVTTTGLLNGDTATVVMLSTGAATTAHVGSYDINVSSVTINPATHQNDYNITKNSAILGLTVTALPLTITANSFHKTYGNIYTPTGTEFVKSPSTLPNGDTVSSVTLTSPGFASAAQFVAPGPVYTITPSAPVFSSGNATDYTISNVSGSLIINQAALSITAGSSWKTYGSAYTPYGTEFSTIPSTLPNGDWVSRVTLTSPAYLASATFVAPGPTYVATPSNASFGSGTSGNYNITYVDGDVTILQASLTIWANSFSKTYGTNYTPTGTEFMKSPYTLPNGDAVSSVSLTSMAFPASATVVAPGPTYPIVPSAASGTGLGNYAITYSDGTLTVIPATASVTSTAANKIYGDADPSLTGVLNGFVAADNVTATYSRTAGETVNGGPYTISATLSPTGKLGNYAITYNTAGFTITQRPLHVVATGVDRVYNGTLSATVNLSDDRITGDVLTLASTSNFQDKNVGLSKPVTVTGISITGGAAQPNYSLANTTAAAAASITPAAATVTANAGTKTYGSADPTLSGTLAGFIAADDVTASYSRVAGETVTGGPYLITAALSPSGALGNYSISYNNANFTITPVPLSITATNKSRLYGAPNPMLDGTVTGVQNNDGITASYSTSAAAGSNVGNYPITATVLDPNSRQANYTITNTPGSLTVTQAPLAISANDKSRVYGYPNPSLDGTVSGVLNNDGILATFSTNALVSSNAGTYPITATPVDPNGRLTNYAVTNTAGTLTIAPAPTTTTLQASSTNSLFGTALTFTATVALVGGSGTTSGTVTFLNGGTTLGTGTLDASGKATYSTSAITGGVHSISAVFAGSLNNLTSTSGATSVNVQDFALPSAPPSVSVTAGQSQTATFSVAPVSGFGGTVSFTCAVPSNMSEATCSATSLQITGTSSATSTLTLQTTAPHQLVSSNRRRNGNATSGFAVFAFAWLGIPLCRRRRVAILSLLVLTLLVGAMVSCGGSSPSMDPGTPKGVYTVVVTGTSGTAVHSMNVSVTVQ